MPIYEFLQIFKKILLEVVKGMTLKITVLRV
jgi:hypothetical protein